MSSQTNSDSALRSLLDYGARGDGISDDGEAFQRALNERPDRLLIPAGAYRIGRPLRIHGGTSLLADQEATIKLADGVATKPDDYLLSNASPETGDQLIQIQGGTWDGNNRMNPRPKGLFDFGCTGALMHFENVRGLRLESLHFKDAEAYHARFTNVADFHIEGISFSSSYVRPNNDGIHLGGNCRNGVIRKLRGLHRGVTGDDLVALNADDALKRTEVLGMQSGPIRDILIEDLEAYGCHSFVRLLSVFSTIENITIRGVKGDCDVAALNCDAARGCRVPVFDEANPPFLDGVGLLRNIDASDLCVAKTSATGIPLLRMETRMEQFRISNFRRDLSNDHDPKAPTFRFRYVSARVQQDKSERAVAYGEILENSPEFFQEMLINP